MGSARYLIVLICLLANVETTCSQVDLLYQMTNGFLNTIQKNSALDTINSLLNDTSIEDILSDLITGSSNGTALTLLETLKKIGGQATGILKAYIGFSVCVAIGVVITVGMLFTCLCFGARRKCGACGAGIRKQPETKADKPKRIVLALVVIVFIILIAGGAGASYLAGVELTNQFKSAPVNHTDRNRNLTLAAPRFIANVVRSVNILVDFVTHVVQVIADYLESGGVLTLFDKLKVILNNDMLIVKKNLNSTLNTTTALLDSIVRLLSTMNSSLGDMQQEANQLTSQQSQLNASLRYIADNATTSIANCTTTDCSSLRDDLPSLITSSVYMFPNLSSALDQVHKVQSALQGVDLNFQLPNTTNTESVLQRFNESLRAVTDRINSLNLSSLLDLGKALTPAQSLLNTISTQAGDNGKSYIVGVCTTPIIVIIFSLLCIFIGICAPAKKKARITRASAENMSTSSAGSAFSLATVLMLITTLMFIVGGLLYIEVCRDVDSADRSFLTRIDTILRKVSSRDSKLFPSYIHIGNFLLHNVVYVTCKKNDSIIDSFLKVVDIPELLGTFLNDLNLLNQTFNDFIPPDVFQQLNGLNSSLSSSMNFSQFDSMLQQNITRANLTAVAEKMDKVSSLYPVMTDLAWQLRTLHDTLVFNMTNSTIVAMNKTLGTLRKTFDTLLIDAKDLSANLRQLQANISAQVKLLTNQLKENITTLVQNELRTLSNKTRCRGVFDGINGIFTAVCTDFLNPFNALWFAFGWLVVMFIPHAIFGVWLGGLYARKPAEEPSDQPPEQPNQTQTNSGDRQQLGDGRDISTNPSADYVNPPYRQPRVPYNRASYMPTRPPPLPYRPPYLGRFVSPPRPSPYGRLPPFGASPYGRGQPAPGSSPYERLSRPMRGYNGPFGNNYKPRNPYTRQIPPPTSMLPIRAAIPSRYGQTPGDQPGYMPLGVSAGRGISGPYNRRVNMYLPSTPPPHY